MTPALMREKLVGNGTVFYAEVEELSYGSCIVSPNLDAYLGKTVRVSVQVVPGKAGDYAP